MIFEVKQYRKKSFLQRIFHQEPDENSIIELNNLLATKGIMGVTLDDVCSIEAKYGFKLLKEFRLNLEEFYLVYFNSLIGGDFKIANRDEVRHLQLLLGFGNDELNKLIQKLGTSLYEECFENQLKRTLDLTDKLENLVETTQLSNDLVGKIRLSCFTKYTHDFVSEVLNRNRYSHKDEIHLSNLAKSVRLPLNISKENVRKLSNAKLLWEYENLELPNVSSDIDLKKGEICHFKCIGVDWYEFRSNRGVKFLKHIYSGKLYITNKRIVFESFEKNTSIKLVTLMGVFLDGAFMEIRKDTGRIPYLKLEQIEVAGIVLRRLLNK